MFRPGPPRDLKALPDRFSFGDVEVDVPAVRVTRAGSPLALEPKSFDVLLLLAANGGRVVEKDEIVERLWRDVGVTDNALTKVIAHLRRDLGDEAIEARYIETVRTRGYRFLPDIEPLADTPRVAGAPRLRWILAACGATGVLVAALVIVGPRARRTPRPAPRATLEAQLPPVQLTFSRGFDGRPSFSPDGGAVAYTSERDGKLDVFVRRLDDGSELQITHGGGNVEPAFSPDGRWVAFHSRTRGGLWLVPPLGGQPRQLTESGSQPSWSPDARQIAFRTEGALIVGRDQWPGSYGSVVGVVDVRSGQVRRLTTPVRPPVGQGSPAWMPDGRAVVFAAGDYHQQGIYMVGAESGVVETLVESSIFKPGGLQLWRDPVPLPDGTAVLAVRSGGSDSIQRLPLPPGHGEPVALVPLAPYRTADLAVSPDGGSLAFVVTSDETRIEAAPVDAVGRRRGPSRTLAYDPALRLMAANFSPDGRWLVCARKHPGAASDFLVVETATGTMRELVSAVDASGWWGRWWPSPTEIGLGGLRVDLVTGRRRESGDLVGWKRIVDRYHPQLVPDSRSPDGSRVLFAADVGTARELFVWRIGAEDARQVSRFGRIAGFPRWSRDGTAIVTEVWDAETTTAELWLMDADGSNPRLLPTGTGPSWVGSFSPEGALVAYAALRGSQWDIAVAGPNSPERLLGLGVSEAAYVQFPAWSPHGNEIAYERTTVKSNIWILRLKATR